MFRAGWPSRFGDFNRRRASCSPPVISDFNRRRILLLSPPLPISAFSRRPASSQRQQKLEKECGNFSGDTIDIGRQVGGSGTLTLENDTTDALRRSPRQGY
jgi:hypothetical protein